MQRAALGLRDDAVVYLCCQSLSKYLPRDDAVWPRIAARVPAAQFLFLSAPGGTATRCSAPGCNARSPPPGWIGSAIAC